MAEREKAESYQTRENLTKMKLKEYLQTINVAHMLRELGAENANLLIKEISHFTEKEAERRDKIVQSYFGESGINEIVQAIMTRLTSPPKLKTNAQILDIGAGSGFFTLRVADELKRLLPKASFYAMDATPAMLSSLATKTDSITPFFGIAENISGSIRKAREYVQVPVRFDAAFSTLMLHHCSDVDKVFRSLKDVMKNSAKAVIVDLCAHAFTEFHEEMGDLHLGFETEEIRRMAEKVFPRVAVERLPGICCESSGRCAELFVATMKT